MNDVFAAALELQTVCQKRIAHHNQPFAKIKRSKRGK